MSDERELIVNSVPADIQKGDGSFFRMSAKHLYLEILQIILAKRGIL
jgi:hypothetical protein